MRQKVDTASIGQPLPCPFCGLALVERDDQHGSWMAHDLLATWCPAAPVQIFDATDMRAWNTRAAVQTSGAWLAVDHTHEAQANRKWARRNARRYFPCPACGAEVGSQCRSKAGGPAGAHAPRIDLARRHADSENPDGARRVRIAPPGQRNQGATE